MKTNAQLRTELTPAYNKIKSVHEYKIVTTQEELRVYLEFTQLGYGEHSKYKPQAEPREYELPVAASHEKLDGACYPYDYVWYEYFTMQDLQELTNAMKEAANG